VAGIQRREIVYAFQQLHRDLRLQRVVPIEHAVLVATRWDEETVRSVQGALVGNYSVTNTVSVSPTAVLAPARRALNGLRGVAGAAEKPLDGPELVLLPYGTDARGVAQLRYAYRMQLAAAWRGRPGRFLLWADAATAKILALEPLISSAMASGRTYHRDPGVPGTLTLSFEVDPPTSQGNFTLTRANVTTRLNYRGGVYDISETSVPQAGAGSAPSFANFDQGPINDPAGALCASGPSQTAANPHFQQVSVFATLMRHRDTVLGGGIFTPFPRFPWEPAVEYSSWGCNADDTMAFGACHGYVDAACPSYSDGTRDDRNLMNFAHDNTIVAHELAHSATPRLVQARPPDWCGATPCTLPRSWILFHDLADFWAAHLESTDCIGGWVAKNLGGVDASLSCALHDEGGGFPRRLAVTAGSVGGDHFPEHRDPTVGGVDPYADGQIAGAALWQVRAGMRSKCRPSGVPQFGVRFQRALAHAGFFNLFQPDSSDLGTYQRLVELLLKMVEQWATAGSPGGPPAFAHNGAHTTNKVTAGFARAGLFLVPWQCLDADPGNDAALACPAAAPGADAVIDVDDDDATDDDEVNGVKVVDRDFLRVGGPAPVFHVWTGPRYRLDGAGGGAAYPSPAPCNAQFQVEATTDPTFTTITATSPWIAVNRDPSSPATQCYGTWRPDATQWTALQAGGAPSLVSYRARTRDAAGGTERLSTEPGAGLWSVPPPYAVITADGRSDY
jgi:hypothetical protein